MASMSFFSLFFILNLFLLKITTSKQIICDTISCGDIDIKFPFGLKEANQDPSCYYYHTPTFQLSCNNLSQTILTLPHTSSGGDLIIKSINYEDQSIQVNDPNGCLPNRFLHNLSLSGSPFNFDPTIYGTYNLIFLNCPNNLIKSFPVEPISCLSDEKGNKSVGNSSSVIVSWSRPIVSAPLSQRCEVISSAVVPLPKLDMPMWPFWPDLNTDVGLVWTEPGCGNCAIDGNVCGFSDDKSLRVSCFPGPHTKSQGLPRSAKYVLAIVVPGILCIIGLWFICTKARVNTHHTRSTELQTTISLETITFAVGLDDATIENCPKTLLGESRRLLKPSDNTCSICLSEYEPKETLRTMPKCNHYFHADCIDEWLKMNGTCPLCISSPMASSTITSSFSSLSPTSSFFTIDSLVSSYWFSFHNLQVSDMTLNLCTPCFSRLLSSSSPPPPPPPLPKSCATNHNATTNTFFLSTSPLPNLSKFLFSAKKASVSESHNEVSNDTVSEQLLLRVAATAKDADEALQMIAENSEMKRGVVCADDCCAIISAALKRNNHELALSVFYAMRATFDQVGENGPLVEGWKWSRPNAAVYTLLIQGLAASLRVSDALRVIKYICEVGVSPGEEVRFGKVVRCPSCRIAVAVAQPQQGIQIASCGKCRYQYELVSGDIVSIQSEEISMDITAWERGLRFLKLKQGIPAAVHSIVVQTPSGMARTQRFATETVDLPAQEGERVTVAVAAPSNVYRKVGPFKFSPRPPDSYPGEAMCITNHKDGRESLLLRAPRKDGNSSLLKPSVLFPLLAVFATGDAASGLVDPSLPQLLSVVTVSSLAVGATLNSFVLPQFNKLPQGSAEAVSIKQRLLSQYDVLLSRIKDLKEAAEKEIWMLARMYQLENKISAVGEPSYRSRRSKVQRVRESLQNSLRGQIELIDSYARISSMIEIEVEMETDVLAAESASNADSITEQIEQIMELENLEERWKIQAEANDEAERLLSSQTMPFEEG
ncbi:hypothetical protein RIF29_34619 [Crotalaria pallida]|uniref:RING-type domain-containing protein n=1 Tax=Crotalaria pallida TaxID=3830 RepID=A0AAN9EBS1_CROPI